MSKPITVVLKDIEMRFLILSLLVLAMSHMPVEAKRIGGGEAEKIIANGIVSYVEKTENSDGFSFRSFVTYNGKVYVCLSFVKHHQPDVVVNMCIT